MATVFIDDDGGRDGSYMDHIPSKLKFCACCNNKLAPPLVLWYFMGPPFNMDTSVSDQIYLHAGCALSLGMHLIKDAGRVQDRTQRDDPTHRGIRVFPNHPPRDVRETPIGNVVE